MSKYKSENAIYFPPLSLSPQISITVSVSNMLSTTATTKPYSTSGVGYMGHKPKIVPQPRLLSEGDSNQTNRESVPTPLISTSKNNFKTLAQKIRLKLDENNFSS